MLLATLFFRPADDYDQVCVFDCRFADGLVPGTFTDKECEEMGGAPQYGSGKSAAQLAADLVYKSLVCALCSLPATALLDQAFRRTQRLTNARLAKRGSGTAEVTLMVGAAIRHALQLNDLRSAWWEWTQVLELLRVQHLQQRLTSSRLLRLVCDTDVDMLEQV